MWVAEKKIPTGKTVGRDVLLGIVLFFLLLQFLPESTIALVTALVAVFTFRVSGGGDSVSASASSPSIDEMEVRVGVPKF